MKFVSATTASLATLLLLAQSTFAQYVWLYTDINYQGPEYMVRVAVPFNGGCACQSVVSRCNDVASSLKWDSFMTAEVAFFEHDNCQGRGHEWWAPYAEFQPNLVNIDFNDVISSVRICAGSPFLSEPQRNPQGRVIYVPFKNATQTPSHSK
ncbi:hypothetical protein GQ42DRAFT_165649 [Ramicandelaber brevisporus]|nr:hypothetical protein GQ42DRAFT_165649 [Ramicandelaber brevisporus]